MKKSGAKKYWLRTQTSWNDDIFLAEAANAFMKLRWRRLNRRCVSVVLSVGKKVDLVDVGCAHADFYDYVKPCLKTYTGIEPSKVLLPKNILRDKQFRLLRGQAEKLPLKNACADFVLIKEVLDHCYDPLKVAKEAHRVLRAGGECLITLTNDAAWYKRLFPIWAGRIKAGQQDHLYFLKPDDVHELLKQAGFKVIQGEDSHYLRLPYKIEGLIGQLPQGLASAIISLTDAVGKLILPECGGSFWVRARK